MNDQIIGLYRFYSRFVPKKVLEKMFRQSTATRRSGYEEIVAEIMGQSEKFVIPEIDKFIVSINENFVAEQIKSAGKFILFVEYGQMNVTPDIKKGIIQNLAVSVVHPIPTRNFDNLNETLLMNEALDMLWQIIMQMKEEQEGADFCSTGELVSFPLDLHVVDPKNFYGCGGWSALFEYKSMIL